MIPQDMIHRRRGGESLLMLALGEAAEFRQVAEAIVEWCDVPESALGCVICDEKDGHLEHCPLPLAQAALAPKHAATESPEMLRDE